LPSHPESDVEEAPSVLDRPVDLTAVSWYALGWAATFALGIGLRLFGRGSWPLSAPEARIALDALSFVRGESVSPDAASQPMTTGLVAVTTFLFGASDGVARLVPLLAGIGVLAAIYALRPWLGRGAALATAFIVAVSPTMAYLSRTTGAGGVLVVAVLLFVLGLASYLERPRLTTGILAGVAGAAVVMSDPIGWLALPLAALAGALLARYRSARPVDLAAPVIGFGATLVIVSTGCFIRPGGFSSFFSESFSRLWNDHLAALGSGWHLSLFQLITDEPLALVLTGIAVVRYVLRSDEKEPTTHATTPLMVWALGGLVLASLLGGKTTAIYAMAALPLMLLAGNGLDRWARRMAWWEIGSARGVVYLLAVALTLLAALSALGLLMGTANQDAVVWITKFVLVGILILVPLATFTVWYGRQLEGSRLMAMSSIGLLLLVGLSLRSSILYSYTTIERPGSVLTAGQTAPTVGLIIDRLEAISRDTTTYQQDVRDPTGGHGITILVDESIAQPFAWYFREFPNLHVVPAGATPPESSTADAIIVRPDHQTLLPSGVERANRNYAYQVVLADSIQHPNWAGLVRSAFNPAKWREFTQFLIDRKVIAPAPPDEFTLSVRKDVGTRLYGQPSQPAP
jgi:hypothetical protein